MSVWDSKMPGIMDGHVHMGAMEEEPAVLAMCEATGIAKMALVSIHDPAAGEGIPQSLCMKALHPQKFYVFAGLNHANALSGGRGTAPGFAEQVDDMLAMGCDGIKLIEGKPTHRRDVNLPVTDSAYEAFWTRVEETRLPVVWHVGDPEEFWDAARIPAWARERDWGYGPDDVPKEDLYAEVDEVLARHPELRIIFAHFYFLSADLGRAARFLDANPSVQFDLAPGIEMLYNLSRDPESSRDFFLRYADRIVFGTDLNSGLSLEESRVRAGILYRWLESDDSFRLPEKADFLLGPPEDGVVRGMALPEEILKKIYRENFVRLAGPAPRPLDRSKSVEVCERLARIAKILSGTPCAATQAGQVADRLKNVLQGKK